MDGEGQDSVSESKRYVGVTRLQEWVVIGLVQFDGLDWYKKKTGSRNILNQSSETDISTGA